ncbi:MAG: glycosyltransferase family 2 protein [Candidatus Aenigmarchaeota archaeon]|nr:glycosyltransferase family 2 protein [Candidatus Aenigmarchaeota archaeon]
MEPASIVVLTHNRREVLGKTLAAMLRLDYMPGYEIIVVNDGSSDGTEQLLRKFKGQMRLRIINQARQGPCRARNNGIRAARHPIIAIMDDDCIPTHAWLKDLAAGFTTSDIGMVSSFSRHGGTSTAFRKTALQKAGLYDEQYFYYREDTDLVFRLLDAGYHVKMVRAKYVHDHKLEAPKTIGGLLRHALERLAYHKNDVLLYKKHPKRAVSFLDIKLGFIVNPARDFGAATGGWSKWAYRSWEPMRLSSPRGIVYFEASKPYHLALIFLAGVFYVLAVKTVRLAASLKFGKLLL